MANADLSKLQVEPKLDNGQDELEAAAIRIQAIQRGRAARKEIEAVKAVGPNAVAEADGASMAEIQDLQPGALIQVMEIFEDVCETRHTLAVGRYGVVNEIDEDGDAVIDFYLEGKTGEQEEHCVANADLSKLQVEPKLDDGQDELEAAAVRIQAIQRGRAARKEIGAVKAAGSNVGAEGDGASMAAIQDIQPGALVQVMEMFEDVCETRHALAVGRYGVVNEIDEDGDAIIDFYVEGNCEFSMGYSSWGLSMVGFHRKQWNLKSHGGM